MTEVQRGRGRRKKDADGGLLSQRLGRKGRRGMDQGLTGIVVYFRVLI